jgi:hypothetical protein
MFNESCSSHFVRTDPAEPEIRLRLDQPLPVAVDLPEQTLVRRALERSHGRVEEAARDTSSASHGRGCF